MGDPSSGSSFSSPGQRGHHAPPSLGTPRRRDPGLGFVFLVHTPAKSPGALEGRGMARPPGAFLLVPFPLGEDLGEVLQ